MKGIILAGGNASRMGTPFNKFLLTYKNNTILNHNINLLKRSGIEDIGIVIGQKSTKEILDSINEPNLIYFYQKNPQGTAHALMCAKQWLDDDIIVLMADNYFDIESLEELIRPSLYVDAFATFKFKKKNEAEKLSIFHNNYLIEKPENIKYLKEINQCYCGFLIFDKHINEHLEKLQPSDRNEYEITDLYNSYKDRGRIELTCNWYDIGNLKTYGQLIMEE